MATMSVFCFWGPAKKDPPFNYAQVRKDIEDLLEKNPGSGPVLVRLAWHQAGTWDKDKKNGCPNSATMRFKPESDYGANAGLGKARDLLEGIKAKHPNLSYADLWSLAANIAIEDAGGPKIEWKWGRVDGTAAETSPDGRLPDGAQTQDHVRSVFYRMGFSDKEIVALLGAHTLGECHADRSGFVGPWTHDKFGFDNAYFTELLENDWIVDTTKRKLQFTDSKTRKLMMLPADVAFIIDPGFRAIVEKYAKDQALWHKDFAAAWTKLIELGYAPDKLYPIKA